MFSAVVSKVLEQVAERTREELKQYCRMEDHRPFTMNKTEYIRTKDENTTCFFDKRHGPGGLPQLEKTTFTLLDMYGNSTRPINTTETNLLTVLTAYGVHVSSSKDLVRIHKDKHAAEMEVAAHVLAYFDLSSKRLIDDVPKIFETIFAKDFTLELKKTLTSDLNLVGEGSLSVCARYVKDEPAIQAERTELERQQTILNNALRTVNLFFRGEIRSTTMG